MRHTLLPQSENNNNNKNNKTLNIESYREGMDIKKKKKK
jgi:hypothetical protein